MKKYQITGFLAVLIIGFLLISGCTLDNDKYCRDNFPGTYYDPLSKMCEHTLEPNSIPSPTPSTSGNQMIDWVSNILNLIPNLIKNILPSSNTANKIDQIESYVSSANSRLAFLSSDDINTVWVGNIKANSSAAKSDLTESLKILNTIPLSDLNSQDQTDLQALNVTLNVDIEYCDLVHGPYSDYIENIQTYNQTKDPDVAANSMKVIKMSLSTMKTSFNHMTDEMNSIEETDLSPQKVRPDFISMKSKIQYLQETTSKTSNTLENGCTIKCNSGYVVGTDCQCHPACGASYCSGNAVCCGGQCYTPCQSESGSLMGPSLVMGADCQCHSACGANYCSGNTVCCGGQCYGQCLSGARGTDCQCHPVCGSGYCSGNAVCCGGQCYTPCPLSSVMGNDCMCHTL